MNPDDLPEAIGADVMNSMMANPMLRLASISQAAANFAEVAKTCHEISKDLSAAVASGFARGSASAEELKAVELRAFRCLDVRDTCISHIEALLSQVKNG